MSEDRAPPTDLVALTVDIVAAYVGHNTVDRAALPSLIASVHAAFTGLGRTPDASAEDEGAAPAVTARKSLADPAFIVSMIDGKPYKSLRRHLTGHGLTPDDYRARYRLPAHYPMVAPGYSAQRSALAKALGLGRKRKAETPAPVAAAKTKPRRGRPPQNPGKAAKAG